MKKNIILQLILLLTVNCFSQDLNTARMDSLFQILNKKDKFMGSIAVSENGKIIYTKTIGFADIETNKKADVNTLYRIGSVSKIFTATLIFKAAEENKLDLNQTIDTYFPQVTNAKNITIANLLNHRSGIHNFTDDNVYLDYYTKPKTEKELIEIISNKESDFEPNTKASYSNSNYVLLTFILEKAYNKNYSTILNEKIVKPLKLKNTYVGNKINIQKKESNSYLFKEGWQKEPETDMSIPVGAGAIVSNPIDLTKFLDGVFTGKIISEKSLNLMKTIKDGYGSGLFELPYKEYIAYGHDGAIDRFRSLVTYFPKEQLAIAIISNGSIYKNEDILLCAQSSYFNQSFEIPTFESIEVDQKHLKNYIGTYNSDELPFQINITIENGKLLAEASGQSPLPMEASSLNVFTFEPAGIILEFNIENKQMILKQSGREFIFEKN